MLTHRVACCRVKFQCLGQTHWYNAVYALQLWIHIATVASSSPPAQGTTCEKQKNVGANQPLQSVPFLIKACVFLYKSSKPSLRKT